jgi:hypothetical protein
MAEFMAHMAELFEAMQSEYALTNVWPYWIGFALCMVGFYFYNRRHA